MYRKSSKATVGVRNYYVEMAWSDVMYEGACLSLFVPPLQKAMFTSLQKPAEGNMLLKLELPATIKEDVIKLGECGILTPGGDCAAEAEHSDPKEAAGRSVAKAKDTDD